MNKTKQTTFIFDKYASQYQTKYMDTSLYHNTFDLFCKSIQQKNASILEVGCGPGNITHYLLNQCPDFQFLGIDLAPNMIALAQENNPTAQFEILDGRAINKLSQKFDGILCGFCFPYFSKTEAIKFIADAAQKLHKNGILYISTMEGAYEKSSWQGPSSNHIDRLYIHYHQLDYLEEALLENGFKIVSIEKKSYKNQREEQVVDLIIIAQL